MNNVTEHEADRILTELVKLRDRCEKSKSKKIHLKYQMQTELCAKKFDYMVQNKVSKYKRFSNYEDLLQDGRAGLVRALQTYELSKGSFFWWANHYIKTQVSRQANRHSTIKIPIKKAKETTPYKVAQLPIMIDSASSALESIEISERENMVHGAVLKLPPLQRRVIQMYYEMDASREKKSISSICSELKLSNKECKNLLSQAKKFLRKNLEQLMV